MLSHHNLRVLQRASCNVSRVWLSQSLSAPLNVHWVWGQATVGWRPRLSAVLGFLCPGKALRWFCAHYPAPVKNKKTKPNNKQTPRKFQPESGLCLWRNMSLLLLFGSVDLLEVICICTSNHCELNTQAFRYLMVISWTYQSHPLTCCVYKENPILRRIFVNGEELRHHVLDREWIH